MPYWIRYIRLATTAYWLAACRAHASASKIIVLAMTELQGANNNVNVCARHQHTQTAQRHFSEISSSIIAERFPRFSLSTKRTFMKWREKTSQFSVLTRIDSQSNLHHKLIDVYLDIYWPIQRMVAMLLQNAAGDGGSVKYEIISSTFIGIYVSH